MSSLQNILQGIIEKSVKCEECEKRFHTSCINLDEKELQELEAGNGSWYWPSCKADCGLCSGVCGFTLNTLSSQNLNLIL